MKPYRPSNGTEGMIFEETKCFHCTKFDKCELFWNAWLHDIGDSEYPVEWIYDENDKPTCTAFERLQ